MESLNQLDVQSPDHVSVITRDGKVTISVMKDGASVTMGFPIRNVFNTTPPLPLQQPAPQMMAVKETQGVKEEEAKVNNKTKLINHGGNYKLNSQKVREIKLILSDERTMARFGSKQRAYEKIGGMYQVSCFTIANIDKGNSWTHVKI